MSNLNLVQSAGARREAKPTEDKTRLKDPLELGAETKYLQH